MAVEKQYISYADHGTSYRLRPNPDAGMEEGFKAGGVLEVCEDGKTWTHYFFIAAESLHDFADMFAEAAREVDSEG